MARIFLVSTLVAFVGCADTHEPDALITNEGLQSGEFDGELIAIEGRLTFDDEHRLRFETFDQIGLPSGWSYLLRFDDDTMSCLALLESDTGQLWAEFDGQDFVAFESFGSHQNHLREQDSDPVIGCWSE